MIRKGPQDLLVRVLALTQHITLRPILALECYPQQYIELLALLDSTLSLMQYLFGWVDFD